jgi:hypothetical protein
MMARRRRSAFLFVVLVIGLSAGRALLGGDGERDPSDRSVGAAGGLPSPSATPGDEETPEEIPIKHIVFIIKANL